MIRRRAGPEWPRSGEVRRAERADVSRLVELWGELMAHHGKLDSRFVVAPGASAIMTRRFQYLVQNRDALVLVSRTEGRVVGFVVGHVDADLPFFGGTWIGFIADLYVTEAFRRQGRARRLVYALKEWFHFRKVGSVQLHAASCNAEAHEFWRSLGFSDYLVRMWEQL